jgi:ribosomal protein S18 acetylase RimI-like enzyme
MCVIRPALDNDFDTIWPIFHQVVRQADTYPYPSDISREEAFKIWMVPPVRSYLAYERYTTVGTYYIKPNQPGQGAHVANAGFMVDPVYRGHGIGRLMGEHAIEEARRLGYLAMQFNLVVSSNRGAVALWKKLGFGIVGTLPSAFRQSAGDLVDAYIMYQDLRQV